MFGAACFSPVILVKRKAINICMGYSYLKPSILFGKKKKIGVARSLFYNWTFFENILSPFGIGKAVPRFCGK